MLLEEHKQAYTMAKIEDTIAALETKLKQARAVKQKAEARKREIVQKATRAQDTRRKILVGSFFLQRAATEEQKEKLRALLDPYLTRLDDRALFALAPLQDAENSASTTTVASVPPLQSAL
jgi:hypothetical protein